MTPRPDTGGPVLVLRPSLPRRVVGVAMLGVLGVVLVWLGVTTATGVLWQIVLVGIGAATLWLAVRMWQSTAGAVVLTESTLEDEGGRVLAPMDHIASVDRGAFAFKPSNGFLLRLTEPGPGAWAPGLWWRLGRRVGVGGVTSAAQAKAMAELVSMRLASRVRSEDDAPE